MKLARTIFNPVAKGVRQKEFGKKRDEKSDRSIRKSDQKVTKRVPKTKEVIELLLPHLFCGTLIFHLSYEVSYEKCSEFSRSFTPLFCGSEKICQNSRQTSLQQIKTNSLTRFCRRAGRTKSEKQGLSRRRL